MRSVLCSLPVCEPPGIVREADSVREQPVTKVCRLCCVRLRGELDGTPLKDEQGVNLRDAGDGPSIKQIERSLQVCGWPRSEAKHDAPLLWRHKDSSHV